MVSFIERDQLEKKEGDKVTKSIINRKFQTHYNKGDLDMHSTILVSGDRANLHTVETEFSLDTNIIGKLTYQCISKV